MDVVGIRSDDKMIKDFFLSKYLNSSELTDFKRDGYLCCGPILTTTGLEKIRGQCMGAWKASKPKFNPQKTWLENALLPDIHHYASLVRQFYFEGPLVNIAEQIIGPNIKAVTSQLTFKMRGNKMVFPWHQDNGYGELDPYNAISCLTALDNTTPQNGCLWLIPGSNKEGQKAHEQVKQRSESASGSELRVAAGTKGIPITMKAGECLVLSCWTLHQSGPNLSNFDRRILFFRYADADAVEVYNQRKPRLGRLLRGTTQFDEVRQFEKEL